MTFISTDLTEYPKIKTGTYTGNSSANKAIAHGNGITPKYVFITSTNAFRDGFILTPGKISGSSDTEGGIYDVTSWDTTNFYIGNAAQYGLSMNYTGHVYYWVAFF